MLKRCENRDCWNTLIATNDDFCNECFYPTTWAEDASGHLLINTTMGYDNELPQPDTNACFQSSSCELPHSPILTAFDRPDTLLVCYDCSLGALHR